MKTSLTLFLLLFNAVFLFGQSCLPNGISFDEQAVVDAFTTNYPGCTEIEGDLTIYLGTPLDGGVYDFTGLQSITRIGGNLYIYNASGEVKEDLTGLENLTSIGGSLDIHLTLDTGFKSFEGLEGLTSIGGDLRMTDMFTVEDFSGFDNLKTIGGSVSLDMCQFNNFQGLSQLDTIYGDFHMFFSIVNDFTGLNSLSAIMGQFDGSNNSIENFQGLNNLTHLGGIFLIDDGLQSFQGLENLTTISGDIDLTHAFIQNFEGLNQLCQVGGIRAWGSEMINFEGLENLKTISGSLDITNCTQLINLKGLEQVEFIGSYITFFDNTALVSINELENADLSEVNGMTVWGNNSLNSCESSPFCNYLTNGGSIVIDNNGPSCSDIMEILVKCDENLSKVRYFTYYDLNQNQVFDNDEVFYADASIQVDPLTYLSFDNSDNGGTLYLEPGDYTLGLNTNNSWGLTTASNSYPISIAEANTCDTIYFGLYPLVEESQLITTVQSPPTRCLEFITFEVSSKNIGTTIESGTLWLEIDPEILDVAFIDPPDTTVAPYRYGWHFNDLYPSQSVSRLISLQIPGPPDFTLGQLLNLFAFIEFVDQPWVQKATGFRYQPEVRCSYDPNDKLVTPNRDGNYTLFEEWLVYTVRFQNTGNDYAYDVVIRDTLDANLDASTFQVLGSSHENELAATLEDGQFLTFDFSNIFLPDSTTDLEGSQGYVSYLIKGKEGLAENTPIENTASIYFDFNPPIVTNTMQNVMVSEIPTTSVNTLSPEHFNIFPNPTIDWVQVQYYGTGKVDFQLRNTVGQTLSSGSFSEQTSFSIKHLPSGVYWLQLKTALGSRSQKVIHISTVAR